MQHVGALLHNLMKLHYNIFVYVSLILIIEFHEIFEIFNLEHYETNKEMHKIFIFNQDNDTFSI